MSEKLKRFQEANAIGSIDREKGVIYGVSVITGNREASGHGMFVDETMVEQVVELGNDNRQGLKARFDHPNPCASSMGTAVGRFKSFRKDGLQARADLHLLNSSEDSPNGDYRTYILNLAEEDPNAFATSIVFRQAEPFEPTEEDNPELAELNPEYYPHARIRSLTHCDVVDEGAANDGLFGRPDYLAEQAERFLNEHKELLNPFIESIVNEKLKEMSDNKETKNGLWSRLTEFFTSETEKTDEEVVQEFAAITEDVQELTQKNSDLEASLTAKEEELAEKEGNIQLQLEKIQELEAAKVALEEKLTAAGGELPTPEGAAADPQKPQGEEQLSVAEQTRQKKLQKMKEVTAYIEEQKRKKVNI